MKGEMSEIKFSETELDALLSRVREVQRPSNALGRTLRRDEVARDCLRMFEDLATRYREEFASRDRYKAQSNSWRDKALTLQPTIAQLAEWMIRNSYATGHGDSVESLLAELKWQIDERISSLGKERDGLRAPSAASALAAAIAEAIRELKTVPSGELYARLMGKLSLEQYESLIGSLVKVGLVTKAGHLLRWVGTAVEAVCVSDEELQEERAMLSDVDRNALDGLNQTGVN